MPLKISSGLTANALENFTAPATLSIHSLVWLTSFTEREIVANRSQRSRQECIQFRSGELDREETLRAGS